MQENLHPLMNLDQVHAAFDLVAEIQNKEIGTVFFEISGHVNLLNIRIFAPRWRSGQSADVDFDIYMDNESAETNAAVIAALKKIIETGELPNVEEKRNREREERRKKFEELKQEFEPASEKTDHSENSTA